MALRSLRVEALSPQLAARMPQRPAARRSLAVRAAGDQGGGLFGGGMGGMMEQARAARRRWRRQRRRAVAKPRPPRALSQPTSRNALRLRHRHADTAPTRLLTGFALCRAAAR